MIALKPEDQDLAGLAGADLYRALGPLSEGVFPEAIKKASDQATTGNRLSRRIGNWSVARTASSRVSMAQPAQHASARARSSSPRRRRRDPLPGYVMAEGSFKNYDSAREHQITFMRDPPSGGSLIRIDIDESSGIRYGLEVIRNATFRQRTNPYLIREFLLVADPIARSLTTRISIQVLDRGSRIRDRESGSGIGDRGSRIRDQGSKIRRATARSVSHVRTQRPVVPAAGDRIRRFGPRATLRAANAPAVRHRQRRG